MKKTVTVLVDENSSLKKKYPEIPSTPSNVRQSPMIHDIFLLCYFFSVIPGKGFSHELKFL